MIKDIKKTQFPITDVVSNKIIVKDYIQFTTVGKNREWINWLSIEKFKEQYPGMIK